MNEVLESLSYPFDIDKISIKKTKWTKELSKTNNLMAKKIAILGGSTTNELKELLRLFGLSNGFSFEFWESDYNRWYEDGVFGNESLRTFEPDLIYIYTNIRNIDAMPSADFECINVDTIFEAQISKLKSTYNTLWQNYQKPIVVNNIEYPLYRPLGNLDKSMFQGKTAYIDRLNNEISKYITSINGVYLCDINYLSSFVGLQRWFDERIWHSYKLAISFEGTVYLAKELVNIINSIFGNSKKCLVLDLDNTIWGGVIGDDGVENIKLGAGMAEGEAYLAFQHECLELAKRGVILAVASKNDHETGIEGLNKSESLLKESDFASLAISWESKDLGLQKISKELNIGLDSLVFADDNPAERHIISTSLSSVGVIKMPDNPSEYALALDRCGFFESVNLSKDDLERNKFYLQDKKRQDVKSTFANYGEYLSSLQMTASIYEVDEASLPRVTQLINKTNQFNLTMRRTDETEIEFVKNSDNWIVICGKLSDRFGDNGLVSVIGGQVIGDELQIEFWVMSCIVFGRELECAMFDFLSETTIKKGCNKIVGNYIKGPKNNMVANFYENLGFADLDSGRYEFELKNFKTKNRYIEVNNE
jgi:FkbH-like protein